METTGTAASVGSRTPLKLVFFIRHFLIHKSTGKVTFLMPYVGAPVSANGERVPPVDHYN